MEPFAKKLGRSLEHIKQSVSEKMGLATDVTEFPLTFVQLDEKVEAIRQVYDDLYRLSRQALRSDNYGTTYSFPLPRICTRGNCQGRNGQDF